MATNTYQLLFLGLFSSYLPIQVVSTSNMTYKSTLENLGLTFPGHYTPYWKSSDVICAIICASFNCAGFAWNKATDECRIYNQIYIYTEPIPTDVPTWRNYIPENFPITYIKVICDINNWNSAKTACDDAKGTMIYIPKNLSDESTRLAETYGGFQLGLERVLPYTGTWITHYDQELQTSDINFDLGQPEKGDGNCALWYYREGRENGVHDSFCDQILGDVAICDMNVKYNNV